MPSPIRLVHTSDVHLGAGGDKGYGSVRNELLQQGFSNVIDLALREEADALLIAGDFFDNHRVSDETVEMAAEQVRRFDRPVFLVPGNHDPLDEGRLYHRHDIEAMAPNLSLIREHGGQVIEHPELDVVVWGRGYFERDWGFRPLEGIPERLDDRWHIVMAHGHVVTHEGDLHRSLPIEPRELEAAGDWDYLALGHWEPHANVSTERLTAIYSGAPMPLSETNAKAGWAVVLDLGDETTWRLERVDPRGMPA
jgi:DNA repair exonuclease SbcCD nuclease subunit